MEIEKPLTSVKYRIATAEGNPSKGGSHPYKLRSSVNGIKFFKDKNRVGRNFNKQSLNSHLTNLGQNLNDYYSDCYIIEYEVIEKPIQIIPMADYVAVQNQKKILQQQALKEKRKQIDLHRMEIEKVMAEKSRKAMYLQLKKEFEG